uniref:Uncharacterized protein n=1 Tax=Nelumbo nucifera TaxID=4432 RepID=A0A822Z695_NELNU|nr:TPA_asm: hypothetical protein HUJ06_013512 [Nelumbo nucifera]
MLEANHLVEIHQNQKLVLRIYLQQFKIQSEQDNRKDITVMKLCYHQSE